MFNKNFYERERVKSDQGKLNNLGFTLIELLVVISIIGFLATASMVVFNSVRMKARDAKRIADLRQINSALQLYYDTNGTYPTFYGNDQGANWANLEVALSPYLPKLPKDPLGQGASGAPKYYAYFPISPAWWGGSSSCNGFNVLYALPETSMTHQECAPSAPITIVVGETP